MKASRKQWIKFAIVTALYLLFLLWVRSWWGLVVVPFIFDIYISRKIPWGCWRRLKNPVARNVMSWVDAIVFALYGETSGGTRLPAMLRSLQAAADEPTYVKLCFACHDHIYEVTRNPRYERKALRGNKMVQQNPDAALCEGEKVLASGYDEVSKVISAIIGLDCDQYRQTAMLAQGDFQRLLLAQTKEREQIFRHLFATQRFADVQERLKEKARSCAQRLQAQRDQLHGALSRVECDALHQEQLQQLLAISCSPCKVMGSMRRSRISSLIS